jgi:hypothetical protein
MKRLAWSALAIACSSIVVARAATAPPPEKPSRTADRALRATLAADIAQREDTWRGASQETFPSDNWSQSDDFHAREAQRIRELAAENGIAVEDVLRAIDEDLHRLSRESADLRGARAVPCKPRPFYD